MVVWEEDEFVNCSESARFSFFRFAELVSDFLYGLKWCEYVMVVCVAGMVCWGGLVVVPKMWRMFCEHVLYEGGFCVYVCAPCSKGRRR